MPGAADDLMPLKLPCLITVHCQMANGVLPITAAYTLTVHNLESIMGEEWPPIVTISSTSGCLLLVNF